MFLLWCRASQVLHVAFWFERYMWIAPVSWLTRCIVKSPAGMCSVTMGLSGRNVHIIRFGQSLLSYLQNNQNHATQQSALEFSVNSLSKSGSWLLMAPFQVMPPGFLSPEKEYARRVLVYVSLWWAWHAGVEIIATVIDLAWNQWKLNIL